VTHLEKKRLKNLRILTRLRGRKFWSNWLEGLAKSAENEKTGKRSLG
jgi:hypothetical protein